MDKMQELMEKRFSNLGDFEYLNPSQNNPHDQDSINEDSQEDSSSDENNSDYDSTPPTKIKIVTHIEPSNSKPFISKSEKRNFLSSNIKTLTSQPQTQKPLSNEPQDDDDLDKKNDIELMNLIESSKLIEQYQSAELEGIDRRRYVKSKLDQITKLPNIKCPTTIRIGMEKKRKQRHENKVKEAKDLGLYTNKTKHLYVDKVEAGRTLKTLKKSKMNKGLDGNIGTFRNGTLHLSKKDFAAIGTKTRQVNHASIGRKIAKI